ncbi:ABC-2 type transport system permease protein [Priestia taiwanensis]|uniref:ABC-2 family transporter protein n=2 Tax=Priestia taiwanensis TaxID=1347902 RepID=A0A917EU85_9BACI|nr:ABC transporter permease subunit [Priestia taiwanensis]MBM7365070.1 ABC-2 type transport system permease protein [Priestia taiwanensis]GGE83835.1 hypothetical protein GCM10007140_36690 [Priestia taiwanensis]
MIADTMTSSADELGLGDVGKDGYALGTLFIVFALGFLFIASLSHDQINREVSSRTMRFLVTKTGRTNILLGKYLGVWLFWLFCISASFILITFVSGNFLWYGLLECMVFLSVALAFNLIFSIILPKPALSMFFGITFALVFPGISFWAIYSDKIYISWFKYITPYYYSTLGEYYLLINILYAGVLFLIAATIFKGRDL